MKKILLFMILSIYLSAGTTIDVDSKVKLAQKQGKGVVLFFHIPNCSYCKAMLDENFKDIEILKEIEENFVVINLLTSDSDTIKYKKFKGTIKKFSKHTGAVAYPASIYLDKKREIIYRSIGYRNTQEQLMELMFISSKSFHKLSIEEFTTKTEFERDD